MPFGFYDAVSIGLYWFLVVLWAVVVLVFLTRYDQPKAEEPKITLFFRMLLVLGFAILLLDSIYFSTLFGTPQAQTLGTLRSLLGNESLLLPKLALLGTAIAIVYGIFRQGMKEMEAETRNMQKISALNAIASTVSQSLDLDQVLGTTLDKVLEVLEIEAGEIVLRDEQTSLPEIAARRGPRMAESESTYQAVAEVLAGGDIRMIEEYGPENQAFASIPLRSKENILGAMNIYAHPDQPLSQRDLELLAAVGNQIGVAIENASLFRNLNIAYQELSSTQAQLFQSAKLSAVGELAAGIAHEIANPLSTIIGDAQLLLRSTPSDSPAFESAQAIERSGQRARRVIRNLLDFSRQEEYEFSPTDLNANLETALSLIAHQIKGSSIQLITDLGQNLPPIAASPHHLEEVWINLLMNARDSIPEGRQGQITIHSHILQENEIATVVVEISDNGCGIPENKLDRIFEPFYTTKELGKGTGLGLYVVHTIIKRHDGQVAVQSKENEGTTFSIYLPALSPETLESIEDELEYARSV